MLVTIATTSNRQTKAHADNAPHLTTVFQRIFGIGPGG
jgi:hypothetical protein